jgi:hypothetical protein
MPWEHKYSLAGKVLKEKKVHILAGSPIWIEKLLVETSPKHLPKILILGGMNPEPFLHGICSVYQSQPPYILQTYGASEGYFAWGPWRSDRFMHLNLDSGVFYEGIDEETKQVSPIWSWEQNKRYQLVVTTTGGLWRLKMDDVVSVIQEEPSLLLRHETRTGHVLNSYGEQMEAGKLLDALSQEGFSFTAVCYHPKKKAHIYIGVDETLDQQFSLWQDEGLDRWLQQSERHYQIRRETGVMHGAFQLRINTELSRILSLEPSAQRKSPIVLNKSLRAP